MKIFKFIFSIIFFFILVISGKSIIFATNSSEHIKNLTVNPLEVVEILEGDKVFLSIEYIKLETNNTCLLDNITKVLFAPDRLFVLSSTTGMVYCFNREGKYLFTLNKRGRGPRETGEIKDIALDIYNSRLLLTDDRRSIYYYTFEGERIDRHRFGFFLEDIMPIDKEHVAIRTYESNGPDLKIFNTYSQKFVLETMEMYPLDDISSGFSFFSELGRSVLFSPGTRDTIYQVGLSGLMPKYSIDFGQFALPEVKRKEQGKIVYFYFFNSRFNYAGSLRYAWETPPHIGFCYKYSKRSNLTQVLINKQSNRVYQFQSVRIEGMVIDSRPNVFGLFRSSHNVNYGIIDPVIITGEVRANSVPYGRFKSLKEVAAKTSVDDNSIIAIYTLNPNF